MIWFALLTTTDLAEKVVNFRFLHILNSCCLSDESQTQNPMIFTWKPNHLYIPLRIRVSSLQ